MSVTTGRNLFPCIFCSRPFRPRLPALRFCSAPCSVRARSVIAAADSRYRKMSGRRTPAERERRNASKRAYNRMPEVIARTAAWREANRDRANSRRRQLRQLNPTRVRMKALKRFHVRQAAKRRVESEPIDPMAVFRRAKWRCQICGCSTPRETLSIQPRPLNRPTIDHIVPLARGGAHTRANVQCACLRCNSRKKDSIAFAP